MKGAWIVVLALMMPLAMGMSRPPSPAPAKVSAQKQEARQNDSAHGSIEDPFTTERMSASNKHTSGNGGQQKDDGPPYKWVLISVSVLTLLVLIAQLATYRSQNSIYRDQSRAFVSIDGFNTLLFTRADTEGKGIVEIAEGATIEKNLVPTFFSIQPRWKNSGGTPTRNLITFVGWHAFESSLPVDFEFRFTQLPEQHFLGAHAVEASSPLEIPTVHVQREIAFKCNLRNILSLNSKEYPKVCPYILVWGCAVYDDVFGAHHSSEWCYRVQFSRTPGERLSASGFTQYGPYNRTDHDEKPTSWPRLRRFWKCLTSSQPPA